MNRFSITFNTDHPAQCPSCLAKLDDRNIFFWGDIAFCQRCHVKLSGKRLRSIAEQLCLYAPTMYMTPIRGLFLWTPDENPIRPLRQCFTGPMLQVCEHIRGGN